MSKGKLIVLGGGESGVGSAVLARKMGYEPFLSDNGTIAPLHKARLEELALPYEEGHHSYEMFEGAVLVVKSPGIPDTAAPVRFFHERGVEVISEIELAGMAADNVHFYCITGSNGKTTTTIWLHHLLTSAGIDVGLAGNVGFSLAEQVAAEAHPAYVVELSSFQLDGMFRFRATIAILTNITPDHLDRYDHSFDKYIAAKFRIVQNMRPSELLVYGADCPTVRSGIGRLDSPVSLASFGIDHPGNASLKGDCVTVGLADRIFSFHLSDMPVKGRHNIYNAMAAVLAAMRLGVSDAALLEGIHSLPQIEHRMERVGEFEGVEYINDSKGTNVDSTWYALESMDRPVVWIAGGTDKGNDYSPILDFVKNKVRVLVCMGKDNKKLLDVFTPICPVVSTDSLEDAMAAVYAAVQPGDTVLLSPCCASFDLFHNYEDRGRRFKEAVLSHFETKA